MIDPEFLALLACPVDKSALVDEEEFLVCTECRRRYPVTDGIPVLLVERAEEPA